MLFAIYRHLPSEGYVHDLQLELGHNNLIVEKYKEEILPAIDGFSSIFIKNYKFEFVYLNNQKDTGWLITMTYNLLNKAEIDHILKLVNNRVLEIDSEFSSLKDSLKQSEKDNPSVDFVRKELPYKIPKGFFSWRYLSCLIGYAIDDFIKHKGNLPYDEVSNLFVGALCQWFKGKYPLYLISNDLLKALKQSTVTDKLHTFKNLVFPMEHFIVNFPRKELIINNNEILFITVSNYDLVKLNKNYLNYTDKLDELKNHNIDKLQGYKKLGVEKLITVTAIDSKGGNYALVKGIKINGELFDQKKVFKGSLEFEEEDNKLTDFLFELVIQINLILVYKPELLEVDEKHQQKSKGFGINKNQSQKLTVIHPRWIGKNYKIKQINSAQNGGKGSSKITHWRAGHWRDQPYGKRDNPEYRPKFIEPVLVNGNK